MAQSVQKTLLKAQTLVRKGDPDGAAELYKSVLAKYPKNRKAQDALRALKAAASMAHGAQRSGTQASSLPTAQDQEFAELTMRFNQGQLEQAEFLARRLMARPGGHAEAANILGAIHTAREDHIAAIEAYSAALKIKPDYADAHYNLARAQAETGDGPAALESYTRATKLKPGFVQAHYNLANLLTRMGHPDRAAEQYRETARLMPDFADAHANLGTILVALGQHEAAIESLTRAIGLKPELQGAHLGLGRAYGALQRIQEAIPCFRRALELTPNDADAMSDLGYALNALGQYPEAEKVLKQALTLQPEHIEVLNNLGNTYTQTGRDEEVISVYTRILALQPDNVDAYSNLCDLYEKRDRRSDFCALLDQAVQHCPPDHPLILFRRAQAAVFDKNDAKAEALLDRVDMEDLSPANLAGINNLMGKVCDRLGKYDKAFARFEASNAAFMAMPMAKQNDPDIYYRDVQALHKSWTESEPGDWAAPPLPADAPRLAFLLSFPRSGTTLLDTILRSHPEIGVIEEKPVVERMRRMIGQPATPEVLDLLTRQQIVQLRHAYAAELKVHLGDGPIPPVVVDKLPLNTVNAGLIQRVFPDARFIFALRHPCDSALSCFMQNFDPNTAMTNFTDIERTARLYDLVMSTWEGVRARLPLKVRSVRYEELVQDLRGAVEPVLQHLDLEWDENVVNFQETAKSRKRIHTASYNQVTEKLYTRASGRWKHYEKHMAPALPLLMPWAKHFGYT